MRIIKNLNLQELFNLSKFFEVTNEGDDKGVKLVGGQFSVGSPNDPRESVFGGGDSYPVESAFLYNTSNESGNVIASATDVTLILQTDVGSTTPMFESNLVGDVILVGSDNQYYGAKAKFFDNGVLEPNNIIGEYYSSSDTWKQNTYMSTNANYPYQRAGYNLSTFPNEQIRFGDSILDPTSDWAPKTLIINGEPITKYWARIRLLSPITQVPILEQLKHHTNRTEINNDGVVELFGRARGVRDIITGSYANNLSDPINENVIYFTGGVDGGASKLVDNEFANNTRDSRMLIVKIDDDIDTSSPLLVSYPFYVKGSAIGNIRFDIEVVQINTDFNYNTLVSPDISFSKIYQITTPSNLKRQVLQFEVPINRVDPSIGGVAIVITRDANLIEDTLAANIVLTGDNARGRRWRL